MSHKTFKVCILNDQLVENFYIKHYIDEIQPVFERFKNQVFRRNPSINTTNLRTYWIDSENDEILIACEEDFRVFLEEGQGRKVYFSTNNTNQQDQNGEIAMEAEEIQVTSERCSRKGKRDEEKNRRHAKKLADKLKRLEETCLKVDGKSHHHSEKREHKHAERMEKAKRRVEQIRAIIGSIDPANLSSSESRADVNNGASTSNESATPQAPVPSPETIRLLSGAIAGCLQPCSLINKILNEVIGMIPQMESVQAPPPPYTEGDQQKQPSESPRPSTSQATNTSYVNTPIAVTQASNEIEALFKEAAKELEKMNEIVNNTTAKSVMETSTASSSTGTVVTQIENTFANINDSGTSSNATVIIAAPEKSETDGPMDLAISMLDEEFKSATPSKSIRSRESSIEVHDVNSLMSDDSRDCWTILDQEEMTVDSIAPSNTPSRVVDFSTGAIPKHSTSVQVDITEEAAAAPSAVDNGSQVEMPQVSIETQTPATLMSNETKMELQASVQKSIDIVQKSLETIQKTMESAQEKLIPTPSPQADSLNEASAAASAPPYGFLYPKINQQELPAKNEPAKKTLTVKFEPAVIVYDPNPKINAAVHTMIDMGYNNEGNWLTQLLLNVDGDVEKAINFLSPQPKPSNKNK